MNRRVFRWFWFINTCLAVIAFAILLASSAVRANVSRNSGWTSFVSLLPSTLGVFSGLFTLSISIFGCIITLADEKKCLCFYLVGLLLVVVFQTSSTLVLTNYHNTIRISNYSLPSRMYTRAEDVALNDGVLSVYVMCCTGCEDANCTNQSLGGFPKLTLSNCAKDNSCQVVPGCDQNQSGKCFVNTHDLFPPCAVNGHLCKTLSKIFVDDHPIVGPAHLGSCGGGDPQVFQHDFDLFVGYVCSVALGVFIGAAVSQALALASGVYIMDSQRKALLQEDMPSRFFSDSL